MKNIMLMTAHVTDFDKHIVQVSEDHAAWRFCERWRLSGQGNAWIDMGEDSSELLQLAEDLWNMPHVELPCQIDSVIFASAY